MTYKQKLLLTQGFLHILFVIGLLTTSPYVTLPTILISQIVYVGLCGTVFFHRTVAHKNDVHPLAEKILLILSLLGATSSALAWAGVHRKHHRYSDTEKDPHCPMSLGRFSAYWQMSDNDQDIIKYVPDLLRKPWYYYQHKYYFHVLHTIHILGFILLPFQYYWMFLIVPAVLMWMGGSLINIYCHDDTGPINNNILGFWVGGEGWHKNHHEEPSNPSFRHWADWGGLLHKLLNNNKGKNS